MKLEEVKAPHTLGGASYKKNQASFPFFFVFSFLSFSKNFANVDDQYEGRVDFLHRNSGGGSAQREYVAHCSNGRINVRFTIMFMGACVAEGDKAMDTS